MEGVLFVKWLRTKNRLEMLPLSEMGVQGPLCQDSSYKI